DVVLRRQILERGHVDLHPAPLMCRSRWFSTFSAFAKAPAARRLLVLGGQVAIGSAVDNSRGHETLLGGLVGVRREPTLSVGGRDRPPPRAPTHGRRRPELSAFATRQSRVPPLQDCGSRRHSSIARWPAWR